MLVLCGMRAKHSSMRLQPRHAAFVPLRLALALVVASCGACSDDAPPATPGSCVTRADCAADAMCSDGRCVPALDAGADLGPTCACVGGERCVGARCVAECGAPDAEPCASGDTCDFATGRCVASGTAGILTGVDEVCGARTCRPGTECALDGRCVAAPPCGATRCSADDSVCWGSGCASTRPAGACAPAPLDRLNAEDFLLGGDGGAFDLEFDDACNAYAVTMISGTDYLRQLAPDGTLTVSAGVTNLNMGEVVVLREPGGEFGVGDGLGEVALTYICCAACGCVGADPQGVARLDRAGTTSLPMVVIAMPSAGLGPWASPLLDTGPYGLTWGRDNRLYIGNVTAQGDLVRADLDTGETLEIHRFDARILATATFDASSLLVALEGGRIVRASVDTAAQAEFADLGAHATSLVRDPFTGRVYVALATGVIVERNADGSERGEFTDVGTPVRIAYAADGYLYALEPGWPRPGAITRYALPTTR